MSVQDLNRVKYSGFDFDTIEDDLRARILAQYASVYNDFATASLGIMLLDVVSFGLDTLSFYVDRRASESYLQTARTRQGVARLCRQIGYKMRGAIAASVDLVIHTKQIYAFNVPIAQDFQFLGPNGLVFSAAQSVVFAPADQGPPGLGKTLSCYQGTRVQELFVSDGTPNQVFYLAKVPSGQFIASGTVTAVVDGVDFNEVDFLNFLDNNQFEIGYNDSPPTCRFGDGTAGSIPVKGASIAVAYVATSGLSGKVASKTIAATVLPLTAGGASIPLLIVNPEGSSGGDDQETIQQAQALAGRVFNARQIAITQSDYQALAGAFADPLFGRVAVAQAVSSRSAATDVLLVSLLGDVSNVLANQIGTLQGEVAANGVTALSAVIAALNNQSVALTSVFLGLIDLTTKLTALTANEQSIENLSLAMQSQCAGGLVSVGAIPAGVSDQLTPATAALLAGFFNSVNATAATVHATSASQVASLAAAQVSVTTARTSAEAVGAAYIVIADAVGTNVPPYSGLCLSYLGTIQSVIDYLNPSVLTTGLGFLSVKQALDNVFNHVDRLLSADCQSNLVSVPILTKDSAGFYAAPSNALIQVLQVYLNARKEVTQTVEVSSGAVFLLGAVISVRVGVLTGFSPTQFQTAVGAAIDGLLRGRAFGQDLYVSDLERVIGQVPGFSFTNVSILGYTSLLTPGVQTDLLDPSGNLVIPDTMVVTKGSVTVLTPEVLPYYDNP